MQRSAVLLLVAFSLLLTSGSMCAESISLGFNENVSNGSVNFYTLSTGDIETSFFVGDSFLFSGLAGVDFVALSPAILYPSELAMFSTSYTSTTVTITEIGPLSLGFLYGDYTDLIEIYSTSTTLGPINYSITATPNVTGTVLGPVAAEVTPEPASVLLAGTGVFILLICDARRRSTAR